ncbi:MAG TPA: glycosyltransferase family 4 protein [Candidatus Omnitrophota bacterium]|nr:glycosyltransferase family 4 protein [Candidatus Omnitrophota bacterium]
MKILHITTHLHTGGITTYLLTLVREQTKAGHEVYVWASDGVCAKDFRDCCAGVISDVPRCKSELSPKLWGQLPKLVSFLKKNRLDILHTHTRVAQVLTAAATFFVQTPYVSTAHMFYKNRLGRRLFPCWGRAVMAISQTMKNGLYEIFGEKHLPPVIVALNGIDVDALRHRIQKVDRQAVRKEYGYEDRHFVVLALSRLIPVKGVHILIEAFLLVHKEFPEVRLLVAGMGDEAYARKLKNRVAELGLGDAIRFLGNVTETEKPLKAADVFAAPYLWPEAFGLSILEAMTAGLPAIGSNSGGIAELLGYGKRGLLFEEGNVPELAGRILQYKNDPALREERSRVGRLAAADYSSVNMYRQIQDVYEKVLKGAA